MAPNGVLLPARDRENYCSILLLFLLLLPLPPTGQAQLYDADELQLMTHHVRTQCNGHDFENNSTIAGNLVTLIGILTQMAAAGETYYRANVTRGSNVSSWVYGAYQCRGDLSRGNCSICIQEITSQNYACDVNVLGKRVYYVGCYYRYENYDFSTGIGLNSLRLTDDYGCSTELHNSSSRSQYITNLAAALNWTTATAPVTGGYASVAVGSAYALSQCLGFLSPSLCSTCLTQSASPSHNSTCLSSTFGFFYYDSCYILFSNTNFLLSNVSFFLALNPASSPLPSSISVSSLLPGSAAAGSSSNRISTATIAGISIVLALTAVAIAAFYVVWVVNRRRSRSRSRSQEFAGGSRLSSKIPLSPKFSVKELQSATEKFQSRNKLGQGGFGVVYKGILQNGKEVAIKVISPDRQKKVDFMNEAKLITTVQHRNLIQLLGYAMDDLRWYLVYDYLPNRSLDLHLFEEMDGDELAIDTPALDWKTRFNIISGIARGLCYLHEESHVRIVHRDIKASNILLDDNLEPKIADFGLARLFSHDLSHLTTAVAGTLGYVAPEYAIGGQLSEKVDVYSFGLLTLEILSGRRVIQTKAAYPEQTHILQWAWALYERKQEVKMVDQRMLGEIGEGEVTRVVHMALLCTQTRAQARPSMSHICAMLCNQSSSADMPSRPTIVSMGIFTTSNSDSHHSHHSNLLDSAITELYPR